MNKLITKRDAQLTPSILFRNAVTLLGLKITAKSYKFVVDSTLAELVKGFQRVNVSTLALKLSLNDLTDVAFPIIAHFHTSPERFVLVTDLKQNLVTYHDPTAGWTTEDSALFDSRWSGIALLLEAHENSGELGYYTNLQTERLKTLRQVSITALLSLWVIVSFSAEMSDKAAIAGVLLLCGSVTCSLLIATDLGSNFADPFCKISKKTNCKTVLNSPAAALFGWLKMSDIGWIWFFGAWLTWNLGILTNNLEHTLIGILAMTTLALPYVPFSILYQWLKVKNWCLLCLVVLSVFVVLFLSLFSLRNQVWELLNDTQTLVSMCCGYAFSLLIVILSKPYMLSTGKAVHLQKKNQFYQEQPEIFKILLFQQPYISNDINFPDIIVGNLHSEWNIIVIVSPFCKYCAQAYHILTGLVSQMDERLSLAFRFSVSMADTSSEEFKVAQHLLAVSKDQQLAALAAWFQSKSYSSLCEEFPIISLQSAFSDLQRHVAWANNNNIALTPTICINNHFLPSIYTIQDVVYHLPSLALSEAKNSSNH